MVFGGFPRYLVVEIAIIRQFSRPVAQKLMWLCGSRKLGLCCIWIDFLTLLVYDTLLKKCFYWDVDENGDCTPGISQISWRFVEGSDSLVWNCWIWALFFKFSMNRNRPDEQAGVESASCGGQPVYTKLKSRGVPVGLGNISLNGTKSISPRVMKAFLDHVGTTRLKEFHYLRYVATGPRSSIGRIVT